MRKENSYTRLLLAWRLAKNSTDTVESNRGTPHTHLDASRSATASVLGMCFVVIIKLPVVDISGKSSHFYGIRMIRQIGRRKLKRGLEKKDWSVPVY